ncbi:MAG: SidA/IucD/PvdA family monooxygenase [Candidatus Marinimicrobia bacterium]|nr:SidA/IucD/PvdA family monooxygenase [Candidatus Neomarinimicrobiota bacterium]
MEHTPILIIGAGPYGLSLANYLAHRGRRFIIAGRTMELWKEHTFDNMRLRSDYPTSVIKHPEDLFSFQRFCAGSARSLDRLQGQLPVSIFREYIDWCLAQLDYTVREQYVTDIQSNGAGFQVELESGDRFRADRVVIATGIAHHLHIPAELQGGPTVIHSWFTRDIQRIQGQRVLVVGAGQSAGESIAVLLANGNQVEWHTLSEPIYFSEPLNLPEPLFSLVVRAPALFHALPSAPLNRLLAIFSASTITPNFKPLLENVLRHRTLPALQRYDTIIAGTGYRYDLRTLNFLPEKLKSRIRLRRRLPVISRNFESSVPGLYFLGAITEPSYGPSMKFMIGSHYTAKRLAAALA